MEFPHLIPYQWPSGIPATKFASTIRTDPIDCQIALIGLPDDTGVSLNNGRTGAKEGPAAFRSALAGLGVANPCGWDWPRVFDAGDVAVVPGDLYQTHDRVTQAVEAIVEQGLLPIGIGGGHDLTFPFVRAVANILGPLNGVYFDPHLDVRETDGSGMPFRRLVETGSASSLRIHGFDPMSNTSDHTDWFRSHNGTIDTLSAPTDSWPSGNTFVSLDLDVMDASYAPGVSAMNPCGWSPELAASWVYQAGLNSKVQSFDIMELSPANDDRNRTARFAVRMFLTFLKGFAERQL